MDENQAQEELNEQPLNEVSENEAADSNREEATENEAQPSDEPVYSEAQFKKQFDKRIGRELKKRGNLERKIAELEAKLDGAFQQQPRHDDGVSQEVSDENLSPHEYARRVLEEDRKLRAEEEQRLAAQRTQKENYHNVMKNGRNKYDDFEEMINEAQYTPVMVEAASFQPNSEDILYYLAHNQDEVEDIASKPVHEQIRYVNSISHKVKGGNAKKLSDAAPPARKTDGNAASLQGNRYDQLQNRSFKELAAMRRKGEV